MLHNNYVVFKEMARMAVHHLFSFLWSLQDYKIHMYLELVNTVHAVNKNICFVSIVKKWNQYKSVQQF